MRSLQAWLAAAVSVVLVSCGSASAPTNVPSGGILISGGGKSLPGAITLQIGLTLAVSVSQPNYAGPYVFVSQNAAVVALLPTATSSVARRPDASVPGGAQLITADGSAILVGAGVGSTFITIRGGNAALETSAVTVLGGPGKYQFSPSAIAFTAAGQTQSLTVSESGNPGPFSLASNSDSSVATVGPSSGTVFTVTAGATAGTTVLTFVDGRGLTGTLSVGLTITSGTVQSELRRRPAR